MAKKVADRRKIENLMTKYGITIQELCLSVLVKNGIPSGDAFAVVYPELGKIPSQREQLYAKLIAARPSIIAYMNSIQDAIDISGTPQQTQFDLSTKEGLLAALEAEVIDGKDAKQRADILMKIADLRRMKQEEDTDRNKLIHYYLPLRCEVCPYKKSETTINQH